MLLKFNNGIRGQGLKQDLHLGSKKTLYDSFGQIHELEVVKGAVGFSTGLQKVTDWILWMGWPPPRRKKRRPKHSYWKRMMVVQLDQLASGTHSEGAALRREQQEQLESNHCENQATGKEGEVDHRRSKHSSWKRRNGSKPVGCLGQIALRREQCGM
jgi:hypothetical protein